VKIFFPSIKTSQLVGNLNPAIDIQLRMGFPCWCRFSSTDVFISGKKSIIMFLSLMGYERLLLVDWNVLRSFWQENERENS